MAAPFVGTSREVGPPVKPEGDGAEEGSRGNIPMPAQPVRRRITR